MCGIGGYVDPRGVLEGRGVLRSLARALTHRGPDSEGFLVRRPFGLAHRRLAIIDPSDAGAQPMTVGPIVVVFNGAIYNYRELRDELSEQGQSFDGCSDTEVLARAYLCWGERFVERLRGMWAFAILDARSDSLLCSRDPFGIKPFYYAWYEGAFLFASEPAALISAGVPARANLRAAAHYLALGVSDHEPASFFAGITPLEAGSNIVVSSQATLRTVAKLDGCKTVSEARCSSAEFAASVQESVRLHLRADVPVGTCLSGGLDSSIVAALASSAVREEHGPRFTAITAVTDDPATDERQYASTVVEHCDLSWHTVAPSASEFVAEMDRGICAQGEPVPGPSIYFQYCVMRKARASGLKVILDGQGADELLCGYPRYVPAWALETASRAGVFAALGGFTRLARNTRSGVRGMTALGAYMLLPPLRRWVISDRVRFLRPEFLACVLELLARISRVSGDLHSARVADIAELSLPALLRFEDRNSMAHSIEARVPYVDRSVVACALRLPESGLLHDGFSKYPLRQLAARVLPPEIAWRRIKIAFEPPMQSWLGALRQQMQLEVERSPLISRLCAAVPRVADQRLALQWRLYNLARWQTLFAVEAD